MPKQDEIQWTLNSAIQDGNLQTIFAEVNLAVERQDCIARWGWRLAEERLTEKISMMIKRRMMCRTTNRMTSSFATTVFESLRVLDRSLLSCIAIMT